MNGIETMSVALSAPVGNRLQSWEKNVDCFTPGEGLMPASFKVRQIPSEDDPSVWDEHLDPDFGESAIGRVAPVDSGTCDLRPATRDPVTGRTGSWESGSGS